MPIDPYELAHYMHESDKWRALGVEALGFAKDCDEAFEADWDFAANMVGLAQMGRLSLLNRDELITIMAFTLATMARRKAAPSGDLPVVPDAFQVFGEGDLNV